MCFKLMILFVPAVTGIVMDKDTAVPAAIEATRSTVKAFAGFIKENVTRCENDLVRAAMKILNENGPGFRILGRVNVQNETNNVSLHFVHVHGQLAFIPVQSKSVRAVRGELQTTPSFGVRVQLMQDPGGQIRSLHQKRWLRRIDHRSVDLHSRRGQAVANALS